MSIHRTDCPNIVNTDGLERFIDVEWDIQKDSSYNAEIQVTGTDRPGLLAEIALKINEADIGLLSMNARTNKEKVVIINMTLEIKDIKQLSDLMVKVKKIRSIIDVYRVTS